MFIRLCAGHCIQIGKSKRARYVIGLRMSPHVRIHLPRHTQRPPGARARTHRHSVAHTHMQAKRRGALVGPYCQEAWTLHSFRCAPQMHQKRRNMKCKGDTRTHACMRHATDYAVLIYAIPATHVAITTHKLKGLALSTTMPAAHTVHINNYYAR